jgi:hypothetical protein
MEPFNIKIQSITQGAKKPVNQEVTQNADGSGGPISIAKKKDVCWENYKMVGMKNKNGKKVPNCVPKNK